ncbi:MAG: DUF2080 family transposase-associated protein [Thermoplasmata archaeon]
MELAEEVEMMDEKRIPAFGNSAKIEAPKKYGDGERM